MEHSKNIIALLIFLLIVAVLTGTANSSPPFADGSFDFRVPMEDVFFKILDGPMGIVIAVFFIFAGLYQVSNGNVVGLGASLLCAVIFFKASDIIRALTDSPFSILPEKKSYEFPLWGYLILPGIMTVVITFRWLKARRRHDELSEEAMRNSEMAGAQMQAEIDFVRTGGMERGNVSPSPIGSTQTIEETIGNRRLTLNNKETGVGAEPLQINNSKRKLRLEKEG